jgi:hypothetical protein
MTIQELRTAFGPESLTRFTRILEEVMVDLIGDGIPAVVVRSIETRTRLSHMLLGFARSWWTDTQIKQLLLRALRNEISARKYATASGRGGLARERSTGCGWLALWLPWRR